MEDTYDRFHDNQTEQQSHSQSGETKQNVFFSAAFRRLSCVLTGWIFGRLVQGSFDLTEKVSEVGVFDYKFCDHVDSIVFDTNQFDFGYLVPAPILRGPVSGPCSAQRVQPSFVAVAAMILRDCNKQEQSHPHI